MSDDRDGFAEWRDNIESRVSTLEVTVETEARVRAQTDNDMSGLGVKMDAQGRLLRALSETQSDHTVRLTRLEAGQARLEGGQARLEAGQARLEARTTGLETGLAKVLTGVQAIVGLLDGEIDNLPE